MGSLPKTSVLVAMGLLLLLLPALLYCDRSVQIELFMDTNCTDLPGIPDYSTGYADFNQTSNVTFPANPFNLSQPFDFQSAILTNYTGDVHSLAACQVGLPCNASGAIQISFNLSDIGACSTAGPPGTLFDKFLLS